MSENLNSNAANGGVAAWQAFVRRQAIVTYPRHPHWSQQAWAEYAQLISCGIQDLFTLSERDRARAEHLFVNTVLRLQQIESDVQIGLN